MASTWTQRSNPTATEWTRVHQTLGRTIAELIARLNHRETIDHFTSEHGVQISEMVNQGARWTQVANP